MLAGYLRLYPGSHIRTLVPLGFLYLVGVYLVILGVTRMGVMEAARYGHGRALVSVEA